MCICLYNTCNNIINTHLICVVESKYKLRLIYGKQYILKTNWLTMFCSYNIRIYQDIIIMIHCCKGNRCVPVMIIIKQY